MTNCSELLLGVDGGGSKTIAWLALREEVAHVPVNGATAAVPRGIVGRGMAAGSNPRSVGWDAAWNNLASAVGQAFQDAAVASGQVACACLSIAGTGRDDERVRIERWAAERQLAERLVVTNDAVPLLYAATPSGHGVAVVSGTGSFAFGMNRRGDSARCGGWGPVLGDEGSGYAIALAGLRAAAKSADGRGPQTRLLPDLLEAVGATEPAELIPAYNAAETTPDAIARLAPVVLSAAEAADLVAVEIIHRAADELCEAAAAVARQLDWNSAQVPLAVGGSLLVHQALLYEAFASRLADRELPFASPVKVADPVWGAIRVAAAGH